MEKDRARDADPSKLLLGRARARGGRGFREHDLERGVRVRGY